MSLRKEIAASLSESSHFSLENYFSYVGLAAFKPTQLSMESLATIMSHHLASFNYRNSTLYKAGKMPVEARQIPSLAINDLFALMVKERGGYCFQQLELLSAVLVAAGFHVDKHLAQIIVRLCSEPEAHEKTDYPKTHEILIIHLDEKHYLVDVGMGVDNPRKPLELVEGEQQFDDDQYRLTKSGDLWSLDTRTVRADGKENEWFRLYRFLNSPVKQEDIDEKHTNLYLNDKFVIPIRDKKLLFGKTTPEKRKFLFWFSDTNSGFFKSIKKNNADKAKTIKFTDFETAESFAKKKFK